MSDIADFFHDARLALLKETAMNANDIVDDLNQYVGGDLAAIAEAEILQLRADKQELVDVLGVMLGMSRTGGEGKEYAENLAIGAIAKHGANND